MRQLKTPHSLAKICAYRQALKNCRYDLPIAMGPIKCRKIQEQGHGKNKKLEDIGEILPKKMTGPNHFIGGEQAGLLHPPRGSVGESR